MKKASGFYADSLEMLLDTMCNVLGGVVFITLTLTVLVRSAPSRTPPDTQQRAEERANQLTAVNRSNALVQAQTALVVQRLQEARPQTQTNLMRLPLQSQTGKGRWPVILSRGQIYPLQFFSRAARDYKIKNTRTVEWLDAGGGAQEARPRAEQGLEPESAIADMIRAFRSGSQTNFYFVFLVKADSFAAFNRAKETAANLGFQYGWEPYGLAEPIVLSRGQGRAILPQN